MPSRNSQLRFYWPGFECRTLSPGIKERRPLRRRVIGIFFSLEVDVETVGSQTQKLACKNFLCPENNYYEQGFWHRQVLVSNCGDLLSLSLSLSLSHTHTCSLSLSFTCTRAHTRTLTDQHFPLSCVSTNDLS